MAKTKEDYSINGKPTGKVSSQCSPYRASGGGVRWVGTWKLPKSLTDSKNRKRATGIQVCWELGMGLGKKNVKKYWKGGTGYTKSTFGFNNGWKLGKWDDRTKWYPYTKQKLFNIHLWVRASNGKGYGPWNHTYKALGIPPKPTMTTPVQDKDTGRVSVTLKQDRRDNASNPCQYTYWRIYVYDTRAKKPKWEVKKEGYTTATEKTIYYDVAGRMNMDYKPYIQVRFRAWAYGFNGHTAPVTKDLYVCYPTSAVISSVSCPTRGVNDKITVRFGYKSKNYGVYNTGCRLQVLEDTEYLKASEIPATETWKDTQILDNQYCTALSIAALDLTPKPGRTSWVRIKTWNQFEDIFYRYSEPWRLKRLEIAEPTAEDDEIQLLQLSPEADGTSVVALLGWNADGKDDSDETEVSWSENENAWRSTKAPSTYVFDWSDGQLEWTDPDTKVKTTFRDSASVHIEDLTEGLPYYVRARRVMNGESGTTYSPYSAPKIVAPSYTPPDVGLSAPGAIARGSSLPLSWTFSTDAMQTEWVLLYGTIESTETEYTDPDTGETKKIITETFTEKQDVMSGKDAIGACVVEPTRLTSLIGNDATAAFAVRVATGGEYITSEGVVVAIADPPNIECNVPATVTEQGFSFNLTSTTQPDISFAITSTGSAGAFPDGTQTQVAGDTIYSAVISPEWAAIENGYSASVALPTGLDFWDGSRYAFRIKAIDPNTQLESEPIDTQFDVAWAHQAPAPSENIVITPSDETDESGFRTRKVDIQLAPPDGAVETDTYEVYRLTPDGSYLIATGQAQDALVTDLFAPFGSDEVELEYRIAVRTVDGAVNWNEYEYALDGKDLRIDFGSQYIELPWNLTVGDQFQKDFEARSHLGESVPQGYWNENVSRKASFSTDLIEIQERDKAATLRALARYDGPVFVRVPDGCAYQANIEVSGLDEGYNSASIAVALDGEEIGLTNDYMARSPEVSEEVLPDSTVIASWNTTDEPLSVGSSAVQIGAERSATGAIADNAAVQLSVTATFESDENPVLVSGVLDLTKSGKTYSGTLEIEGAAFTATVNTSSGIKSKVSVSQTIEETELLMSGDIQITVLTEGE